MLKPLSILALGAAAAGASYFAYLQTTGTKVYADDPKAAVVEVNWVAAAPGRVEPRGGEIRLGTTVLGRIEETLVKIEDKVEEGELLIRLDDSEARARLTSSEAQAEALRDEREKQFAAGREDIRKAEDAIYSAERAVTGARIELDYAISSKHTGSGTDQNVTDARRRLKEARDRLDRERQAFVKAQTKSNLPAPTSAESQVAAARTEVRMAEAMLEKTRIRAPEAGTVLQFNAKVGEIVAPSPENPLVVTGDVSQVRVKAEIDEGDVAKVKIGQKAFVKSVSYPGKEFEGKVSRMAPSLGQAKVGPRGPRRTNDVDVLEVTIDLDGSVPLLPGMRVDAFFRKE